MTIEYLPVGIACNLKCEYCYQEPMRDAGNINAPRNWAKAKTVLERLGTDFTLFGGEPLLAPIEHLREVWEFGYQKYGKNGIQTNGALITDEHIDMFAQYNVEIGISIDGPGELNKLRCSEEETNATLLAIQKICARRLPVSLIVTVTKQNSRFPELTDWLDGLLKQGVRHLNFHILEIEPGMEHLRLSEEQNIDAFTRLYEWSRSRGIFANPFYDIWLLLTEENPRVSCVWNHCDPLTTAAVQGVSPTGDMSNCGRTNKDGVDWIKADKPGFERYLLLSQTPQEVGGCKDCRFFVFCKGQCPGTGIDGDWRNRTANCRTWYSLFERIESDILAQNEKPISLNPGIKEKLSERLLGSWNGIHADTPHGDAHGDGHGDKPHGDSHGDSSRIPAIILDEPPQL